MIEKPERQDLLKLQREILKYHQTQTMTDRERAKFLGLPKGCRIRENAKIIWPNRLIIEENVYIGEGCIIDASGGLTIGANTQFSAYCCVYTHSSVRQALFGGPIERKPTVIGAHCWVGSFSVIYPGIIMGDKVIVFPLSYVHKNVPTGSTVKGFYRSLDDFIGA